MQARSKSHVPTGLSRISAEDVGPLVLLQDTFNHSALPLLPTVLRDSAARNRSYCLVCCERPSSFYSELVARFPGDGGRFYVEGSAIAAQFKENFAAGVMDSIMKMLANSQPSSVILIFDSLSSVLPYGADSHAAATFFRRILTSCKQLCCIVLIVHKECHETSFLEGVKYIASAYVLVGPPADKKFLGAAETLVKRPSGKVRVAMEDFRFRPDGSLETNSIAQKPIATEAPTPADPQTRAAAAMASELTPEQKAAKDAVRLPYQHTEEESDEIYLQGAAQEEEDDPDADLDV